MPEKKLENKKVAMLIAFRNFRDVEYFVPREILEESGVKIKTVSNKEGLAIGADGGEVKVDILLENFKVADFDALVFVGGPGCLQSLDNDNSYKIAKEAVNQGKILASICISPVILAKSGVLEGKKATVWSSPMEKSPIKTLEEGGAVYQEDNVVVDGKLITANGPGAAHQFGHAIVEALTEE